MTFAELKIGAEFEFVKKTKIMCGGFNGIGVKKSDSHYWMGGAKHTIGDNSLKVLRRPRKESKRE